MPHSVERLYEIRHAHRWRRWLTPPAPLVMNPREPKDFPLGRWNLYIGGGGTKTSGYINIDLFALPGVDVLADVERLPVPVGVFTRWECDAVREHVADPSAAMREIERVLAPGGYVHVVTPFCHPLHEYPEDYRRFTPAGLRQMAGGLDVVAEGWRTGPTATLLVFLLEYAKLWAPGRVGRALAHGILGWLLFPARYLDVILLRRKDAARLGNHCYMWLRKP